MLVKAIVVWAREATQYTDETAVSCRMVALQGGAQVRRTAEDDAQQVGRHPPQADPNRPPSGLRIGFNAS